MKNLKLKLPLLILLISISACTVEQEKIEELLHKRWRALETKNINLYSECIADDYPDREKLIHSIEDNFKRIDSIKILSYEPAIYINIDTATVYQEVRLLITINGKAQDLNTREKLTLRKTKQGWKITGGIE